MFSERVWTATDACGNETKATQRITITDTKAPEFVNPPSDVNVQCGEVPEAVTLEAIDNCAQNINVRFSEVTRPGVCLDSYTVTRTWTATDNCGNSTEVKQVITVQDDTAPVLVGVPENVTADCNEVPEIPVPGTVTASDNCDVNVTIEFNERQEEGTCPNSYTIYRTWTATDNCGNKDEQTQVITIGDSGAPILTGIPANVEIECDEVPQVPEVTAEDVCEGAIDVEFAEVTTPGDCAGNYTIKRTWTAADACGNVVSESQTIKVTDTKAPVLSGVPSDVEANCNEVPEVPNNVTATDNCDEAIQVEFSETTEAGQCASSYTIIRKWVATDACGNSTSATQKINVRDTAEPTFEDVPANVEVACDEVPEPTNPTATG